MSDFKDVKALLQKYKLIDASGAGLNNDVLSKLDRKTVRQIQTQLEKAGLYDGVDGRAGPQTKFALELVVNPDAAKKFLGTPNTNLKDENTAMQAQAALNRLGYNVDLDGIAGRETNAALNKFRQENGLAAMMPVPVPPAPREAFAKAAKPPIPEVVTPVAVNGIAVRTPETQHVWQSPVMLRALEQNPERRQYLPMVLDAAKRHGLDPNMFANQIFKESLFNPEASSGRAYGIAQFKPGTARQYGLKRKDLDDPAKVPENLDAAAKHMADLKQKFGSQEMALVAYNGGPGAVRYAQQELKSKNITIGQWMGVMERDIKKDGPGGVSAWRNQTYNYVKEIVSDHWNGQKLERAQKYTQNPPQEQPAQTRQKTSEAPDTAAPAEQKTSGLVSKFDFARSMENKDIQPAASVENTVRSFLSQQFLAKATFEETPGDIKRIPEQKKDPVLANTGPSLAPV
jgi:soluble lytic murein transglycosylase-like protein